MYRSDWAITEEGYQMVSDVLARVDLNVALARERREDHITRAVEMFGGTKMDGTRYTTIRDGIAIVDVAGPIARRADLLSDVSGATSVEKLARDIPTALVNPAVRGMILVFDSPGGEVGGVSELAAYIYEERQKPNAKPIWAYVDVMAASAAMWLAAACTKIIASDTAVLGSVGVVTMAPDPAKSTSKDMTFVSSQSPNKRPDLSTEAGRAEVQKRLDDTADVFIGAVAKYRGMTADAVIERFGGGGVRIGQHAVDAGMADDIGSFEGTLAALGASIRGQSITTTTRGPGRVPARSQGQGVPMSTLTAEDQALQAQLVTGAADDIAALRAELAAERAARAAERNEAIQIRAAAFAREHVVANRILPAAVDPLTRVYAALATAGNTDAVTDLAAFVAGLPAHTLTKEEVPTGATLALGNHTGQTADPKEAAAARRAKLLQSSRLGRKALQQGGN